MSQTILQQIWDKTLENMETKDGFDKTRVDEIKEAIESNNSDLIESILCKEYEIQEPSN